MSPFAALESTVNASVLLHLANTEVTIGAETVPGIFNKPSLTEGMGAGYTRPAPTVQVASCSVMQSPVGHTIAVDGVPYEIAEAEPDGSGLTTLILLTR